MISLLNALLCVLAVSNTVWAFQPLNGASLHKKSSFSSLSSSPPSAVGVRNEMKSPVRVVSYNSPTATATATPALVNGPAHVASLENDQRPNDNNNNDNPSPTSGASGETQTQQVQVQEAPAPTAPTKTITRQKKIIGNKKSPVTIAASSEELLSIMNGNGDNDNNDAAYADDAMTLILFHAHYCKICQRAAMQLNRAVKEYPAVRFAKVEAQVLPEPTSDSLRTLGVSKFPFVQIFRKGQCVASFSTGPTHMFMRRIRDTLDLCLERDDACWDSFVTEFAGEIESNQLARKSLGPLP